MIPLLLEENKIPRRAHIINFLRRAKPSAPGPDGIPCSAWKAAGEIGTDVLHKALLTIMKGTAPLEGFNDSLGIFLPKENSDEDTANSVKRSAENNRPLRLKNTDNKAIAAAINYAIARVVTKWADTQENGFVCGRQGLDNIIDIDARARSSDINAIAAYSKTNPQKRKNLPSEHKLISQLPPIIIFDFLCCIP